ncbi:MAG: DUF1972 domain-containing protein [Gammaproteobacteria bacterium]|nr:DUF1972 domain-containing protein [Gammaproteobacteria bacterium]
MAAKSIGILGSRGIPARYGGFETFAEQLAIRLAGSGVDVTVYCELTEPNAARTYKGVNLVHVPCVSLGALTTVIFDLRCLWRARNTHDVVYMLGYGASPFCFLPRLWGNDVWINMDGIEWARSKWNWLAKFWLKICESAAMRTANVIVADAEGIRSHLQERYARTPQCVVIPYGAELLQVAPPEQCLNAFDVNSGAYYLVVCRLEPENHVLEIVKGFTKSSTSSPLLLFGDKDSGTEYVSQLLQYESTLVRFMGTLYEAEKLQTLRWHCRAYLHGHSVGGTNPSLLEALGCGNAIIAHDNPFNREVASVAGRYFRDDDDLASIIAETDRTRVSDEIRQRSWSIIRQKYTWSRVTESYLSMLQVSGRT